MINEILLSTNSAQYTGIDRKEVDKAFAELKKEFEYCAIQNIVIPLHTMTTTLVIGLLICHICRKVLIIIFH